MAIAVWRLLNGKSQKGFAIKCHLVSNSERMPFIAIKCHKKTMKRLLTLLSLCALCACEPTIENPPHEEPARPENAISTLTEDIEVNFDANTSLCYADCFGDYYKTGLDMWQLYFLEFETKEQLLIEVMVNPNDLTVPTGTFHATSDIHKANGMLKGIVDDEGYMSYSWYLRTSKVGTMVTTAPIAKGSVTVTENGDGTHTATFDLEDDALNKISGGFTGKMIVEDFRL